MIDLPEFKGSTSFIIDGLGEVKQGIFTDLSS